MSVRYLRNMCPKLILLLLVLIFVKNSFTNESKVIPITNKGDYSIVWKEIKNCKSETSTNEIEMNLKLHKKSRMQTQILGNVTMKIPFSDNIKVDIWMWKFHEERGWQHPMNTIVFNRACSDFKLFLGQNWYRIIKGRNDGKCPVPPGVYSHTDLNVEDIIGNRTFLPAQFLYGRYKIVGNYIKRPNTLVGCFSLAVELKPNLERWLNRH